MPNHWVMDDDDGDDWYSPHQYAPHEPSTDIDDYYETAGASSSHRPYDGSELDSVGTYIERRTNPHRVAPARPSLYSRLPPSPSIIDRDHAETNPSDDIFDDEDGDVPVSDGMVSAVVYDKLKQSCETEKQRADRAEDVEAHNRCLLANHQERAPSSVVEELTIAKGITIPTLQQLLRHNEDAVSTLQDQLTEQRRQQDHHAVAAEKKLRNQATSQEHVIRELKAENVRAVAAEKKLRNQATSQEHVIRELKAENVRAVAVEKKLRNQATSQEHVIRELKAESVRAVAAERDKSKHLYTKVCKKKEKTIKKLRERLRRNNVTKEELLARVGVLEREKAHALFNVRALIQQRSAVVHDFNHLFNVSLGNFNWCSDVVEELTIAKRITIPTLQELLHKTAEELTNVLLRNQQLSDLLDVHRRLCGQPTGRDKEESYARNGGLMSENGRLRCQLAGRGSCIAELQSNIDNLHEELHVKNGQLSLRNRSIFPTADHPIPDGNT